MTITRRSLGTPGAQLHHGLDKDQAAQLVKGAIAAVPGQLEPHEIISPTDETRAKAAEAMRRVIHDRVLALSAGDQGLRVSALDEDQFVVLAMREVFGLGFLDSLLPPARTDVQEILLLPDGQVQVWLKGSDGWTVLPDLAPTPLEVNTVLGKILGPQNRRLDWTNPIVYARLPASPRMPAGARVVAVGPPAVVTDTGHPNVQVRLYPAAGIRPEQLLAWGVLNEEMVEFLAARVAESCGILVAGPTGVGKTTFLNFLTCFIPERDRVVTVEDTAELFLSGPQGLARGNWTRLETRPPTMDGTGEIKFIDLVNLSLRLTPRWVIVGEIRSGPVAAVLLQTQQSGHGGMSTIHAATARKALNTLVIRCKQTEEYKNDALGAKEYIADSLDLVVHLGWVGPQDQRRRRVTGIGMIEPALRGGHLHLRYLYRYDARRSTPEHPVWTTPAELGAVYDRSLPDEDPEEAALLDD